MRRRELWGRENRVQLALRKESIGLPQVDKKNDGKD